jgi:hypothetical protein
VPPLDESDQQLLQRMRYAIWGVSGDNGIIGDVKDIRRVVKRMEAAQNEERRGFSRPEKIAIASVIVGVSTAIILVVSLITTAPS